MHLKNWCQFMGFMNEAWRSSFPTVTPSLGNQPQDGAAAITVSDRWYVSRCSKPEMEQEP
jgi:hypothetical protein